ncbi:MAG: GDSL-type esterase/lipase family protein [Fimbriimonas sp.]|nr:GDSL-type esterase/lipase family protein [Fimbriimonas sp.]
MVLACYAAASLLIVPQKPKAPEPPFYRDVLEFAKQDAKSRPAKGQILFIGSSSFTRWTDVGDYFPNHRILNRAFGGSSLPDVTRYLDRVVFPYAPRQIVIYCGENDLAGDPRLAAYKVANRFTTLFRLIRMRLPNVPIVYVSMKPSPSRWFLRSKFIAANRWIAEFCARQRATQFVNVWDAMLDDQGRPKGDIFVDDRLHMNATGYRIWQPILEQALVKD